MAIKVKASMLKNKYSRKKVGSGAKGKKADALYLNRSEEYEMVPMIQKIVNHLDFSTEEDVQRVEEAIRAYQPGKKLKRSDVYDAVVKQLS